MPFYESYRVQAYNRERDKAARRERSFRSCLVILIVSFFLCLIILLATAPWKKHAKKNHEEITEKKTATLSTNQPTVHPPQTRRTALIVKSASTIELVGDKDPSNTPTDKTDSVEDSYIVKEDAKTIILSTKQRETTASMTEFIVVDESSSNTPNDEFDFATNSDSTIREEDAEITATRIIEQTSEENIETTTQSNVADFSDAVALTSSDGSIDSNSTSMYNTLIAITNTTISQSVIVETTTNYPDYSPSESFSEYSKKFDTASSPSPSIDLEESTRAEYSSDKEESQSDITNNVVTLISRSDDVNIDIRSSFTDEKSQNDTSSTTSNPPHDIDDGTSAKYEYRSQFSSTTNTILASDTVTSKETDRFVTRLYNYALPSDEKFSSTVSETTEEYTTDTTSGVTETIAAFTSLNRSTTSYDINFSSMVSTVAPDKNINYICNTSYCRQTASKMMSYMNDSACPCDDFYEYACGGFEAIDVDQAQRFNNYQRIKKQMMKEKQNSIFVSYYESCLQYEKTVNLSEKIKMVKNELDKVGKFYINNECSADHAHFTDLFAELILRHSAFLFDVVPEVDEYHPNSFTLKIGPVTYESPFKTEYMEDSCSENDFEMDSYHVDFEALYNSYKTCKEQDRKDEIRKSVSDALMILEVFEDDSNDKKLEFERINNVANVIDHIIMQRYFSHFPSKSDAREEYLSNNYTRMSLKELEEKETAIGGSSAFINWTRLSVLLKTDTIINKDVQVYFLDAMVEGLRTLRDFAEKRCADLNNAIMALYASKLYQELVLPKQNVKTHCLQVAVYLLRLEATNLYISSFADHEIERINNRTTNMFEQLKETLKQNIRNATWAEGKGKQALLDKIDNLELALPAVSYFKNINLLDIDYDMSQFQDTLPENYFSDSINLMKRYRTLMYTEIRRQFDISVQIWTYYATPFQSQTKVIYSLNRIVIPYGVIDWAAINTPLNYISLATLGNVIALQIAHHFDELGVHYWNHTRNEQPLMLEDSDASENFKNYIFDQKKNFQKPMNFFLPFTNQTVSLTIPQLAVNKQLSRRTGLGLTYDTLDRMRSKVQERVLPWMQFHTDKLFYLAYAQMYCTKTPITSSYVALYESENLPNRVHVFVTMSKNPFIDATFGCKRDSKDAYSVFPHIHVKSP